MQQHNLFGWSEQTWRIIDQIGILLGGLTSILTLLGLGAAVFAYINRERLRQWFTRNRFPLMPHAAQQETRWDGILFTVSHGETPSWVLETRLPDCITLLATDQSRAAAEQIQAHAQKHHIKVLDPIYVSDANNVEAIKQECKHLISRMRQSGAQKLAVDITGGKTPMSLGAFMAAEEERVESIYVSVSFDDKLKKPDMRTASLTTLSGPVSP